MMASSQQPRGGMLHLPQGPMQWPTIQQVPYAGQHGDGAQLALQFPMGQGGPAVSETSDRNELDKEELGVTDLQLLEKKSKTTLWKDKDGKAPNEKVTVPWFLYWNGSKLSSGQSMT